MLFSERKKLKKDIDSVNISYSEMFKVARRKRYKGMGKSSLIDLYRGLDKNTPLTETQKMKYKYLRIIVTIILSSKVIFLLFFFAT